MTDVLATLKKLPLIAYFGPSDNLGAMACNGFAVKRGEMGYYPLQISDVTAARLNTRHGVTEPQRKAMLNGSLFGWDVPAADPDSDINQIRQEEAT